MTDNRPHDKGQDKLQDIGRDTPEGLLRERKGPLDTKEGRKAGTSPAETDQGVIRDERGQDQPDDKKRAQHKDQAGPTNNEKD